MANQQQVQRAKKCESSSDCDVLEKRVRTSGHWNSEQVVNACSEEVDTDSANSLLRQQHCTNDVNQVILINTTTSEICSGKEVSRNYCSFLGGKLQFPRENTFYPKIPTFYIFTHPLFIHSKLLHPFLSSCSRER